MTDHSNNLTANHTAFAARLTSRSVAETIALGRQIGSILHPGDVIALVGRLGAGKTHLSKGVALGLGVADARTVNSPTFVLINEYDGRMPIHHIDAYRLASGDELAAIGFDEMLAGECVILVEWADRVTEAMPPRTLWIEIETPEEETRLFSLRTGDLELGSRLRLAALTGV